MLSLCFLLAIHGKPGRELEVQGYCHLPIDFNRLSWIDPTRKRFGNTPGLELT